MDSGDNPTVNEIDTIVVPFFSLLLIKACFCVIHRPLSLLALPHIHDRIQRPSPRLCVLLGTGKHVLETILVGQYLTCAGKLSLSPLCFPLLHQLPLMLGVVYVLESLSLNHQGGLLLCYCLSPAFLVFYLIYF